MSPLDVRTVEWEIPMVRLRWLFREERREDGKWETVRVLQYAEEHADFVDGARVTLLQWRDVPEVKEP